LVIADLDLVMRFSFQENTVNTKSLLT
jgi:hypothetical protein